MSYRNLIIENPARLSVRNEQLVIRNEEEHTVPIEDISALLIENHQSTLTSAALAALSQDGVSLYVCDEKHLPCGILLPFSQHSRQLTLLKKQQSVSRPTQKRLWQQIVKAKIINQGECLALCGKAKEADFLFSRAQTVAPGDAENAEAVAAAYFFTALFGKGFTRADEDGRNAALNYGYAVLRGATARSLAIYGFQPCLGLHHCSEQNAFNLADDMMEPFRPLVDLFVATNVKQDAKLSPTVKRALFNLLNNDILSDAQHHCVSYAMERLTQSLARCMDDSKQRLLLPQLCSLQQHRYE
ncbi:MAG: type II CRISPR-associated endonuclease Cas1 [Ruthenibacterium sp.]